MDVCVLCGPIFSVYGPKGGGFDLREFHDIQFLKRSNFTNVIQSVPKARHDFRAGSGTEAKAVTRRRGWRTWQAIDRDPRFHRRRAGWKVLVVARRSDHPPNGWEGDRRTTRPQPRPQTAFTRLPDPRKRKTGSDQSAHWSRSGGLLPCALLGWRGRVGSYAALVNMWAQRRNRVPSLLHKLSS